MPDWLPELSDDDLAVLMEALEAWETKDSAGEMFGDVLELMITPGDPLAKAELRNARDAGKLDRKRKEAVRKERSVLLRAKLLTLRDRRRVDEVERSSS